MSLSIDVIPQVQKLIEDGLNAKLSTPFEEAITLLSDEINKSCPGENDFTLYKLMSVCYGYRCDFSTANKSELLFNEIKWARKAITSHGFERRPLIEKAQAYINLSISYASCGRLIEALGYLDKAESEEADFAMLFINKAKQLYSFFKLIPHYEREQFFFASQALRICEMDWAKFKYEGEDFAIEEINRLKEELSNIFEFNSSDPVTFEEIYGGEEDISLLDSYEQWALDNRLYINVYNELAKSGGAAKDVLPAISVRTNIDEGPYCIAFLSNLVHEYTFARKKLYESRQYEPYCLEKPSYAVNTLDMPCFDYLVEELKSAFAISFAIFDKIALLLHHYFDISDDERKCSFKRIWYKKYERSKGVREVFDFESNVPLNALYWLSKDLNEASGKGYIQDFLEAEAAELSEIRNKIAHGYLRVVDEYVGAPIWRGDFAKIVTYEELYNKTLHMLKKARAAIIYVSLAIREHEVKKNTEYSSNIVSEVPMCT